MDIDDDVVIGPALLFGDFHDPVGTRRMVVVRHHGDGGCRRESVEHAGVIGGDHHVLGGRLKRPFRDANHHGLPANVQERLAGQPRRRVARRYNDGEAHCPEVTGSRSGG